MIQEQTKPLPEIRKQVIINAPIEKVWNAIATSEGLALWWMENTFKPILGYEFILKAGPFGDSPCKVTEINAPNKLSFDWDKDWHLTFELTEITNGSCRLNFTHSGWDECKSTKFGQKHTEIRTVMDKGWEENIKEKLPKKLEH